MDRIHYRPFPHSPIGCHAIGPQSHCLMHHEANCLNGSAQRRPWAFCLQNNTSLKNLCQRSALSYGSKAAPTSRRHVQPILSLRPLAQSGHCSRPKAACVPISAHFYERSACTTRPSGRCVTGPPRGLGNPLCIWLSLPHPSLCRLVSVSMLRHPRCPWPRMRRRCPFAVGSLPACASPARARWVVPRFSPGSPSAICRSVTRNRAAHRCCTRSPQTTRPEPPGHLSPCPTKSLCKPTHR